MSRSNFQSSTLSLTPRIVVPSALSSPDSTRYLMPRIGPCVNSLYVLFQFYWLNHLRDVMATRSKIDQKSGIGQTPFMLPSLSERLAALAVSQQEIAKRAGVHGHTVSLIKRGRVDPKQSTYERIMAAVTAIEIERRDELCAWHGLPQGVGR